MRRGETRRVDSGVLKYHAPVGLVPTSMPPMGPVPTMAASLASLRPEQQMLLVDHPCAKTAPISDPPPPLRKQTTSKKLVDRMSQAHRDSRRVLGIVAQAQKNKVQVESNVMPFSQSKFDTERFQARVEPLGSSLHRPPPRLLFCPRPPPPPGCSGARSQKLGFKLKESSS